MWGQIQHKSPVLWSRWAIRSPRELATPGACRSLVWRPRDGNGSALSVQAMTWALDHSQSRGSTLLVLISIANHAGKYGDQAWPGMKTIGEEARVSRNTVITAVAELEDLGELLIYPGEGVPGRGGKTHRYEMPLVPGWEPPSGLMPRKLRDLNTSSVDTSFGEAARFADEAARSDAESSATCRAQTVLTEPSSKTGNGSQFAAIKQEHFGKKAS